MVMPIRQRCPRCHQQFMGSDAIGAVCMSCFTTEYLQTQLDQKKEKYIRRLLEEWKQYGKIIIAVDYDDTISPWKFNEADITTTGIIELLKQAQLTGAYIVCFTACDQSRYSEIQTRFTGLGLKLDKINENPIALPYGNQNKIYANIFLDDRAGLNESLEILETALYRYRGYLQGKLTSGDME